MHRTTLPVALASLAYLVGMLLSTVSLHWHSVWAFPLAAGPALLLLLTGLLLRSSLFTALRAAALRVAFERGWQLAWGVAAVHLLAGLFVARVVMGGVPNIEDGSAYWLQAQTFAQGRLFQPDPGLPHWPLQWTVAYQGRFFSIFPPGFSLLAVPFAWLGALWAAPALYGSLGLLAVYAFFRALGGRLRAAGVLALTACSPQHLLLSGSFLSHTPMLCVSFAAGALLLYAPRRRLAVGLLFGALAGLSGSLAVLTRPPEGLAVCALLAVTALWRGGRRARPSLLLYALLAALGPALYLLYNHALTGSFRAPVELLEPTNRYGFGATIAQGLEGWAPSPGHTLARAAYNANFNLAVLNGAAFGWPLPAFTFALWACCFAPRRRYAGLAALWLAAIAGVYVPFWYHGVCVGARFYHLMIPWLAWLTLEGVAALVVSAGALRQARALPAAMLTALSVLSLALYVPRHLLWWPHPHGRAYSGEVVTRVRALDAHHAVVFLRGYDRVVAPALLLNQWPLERNDVLYAHDRGPSENARLLARFRGRTVRYVEVPYPSSPLAAGLGEELNRF